jgi:hypothetical protein
MSDERRGKPSSSGAERLYNCPGSVKLIASVPVKDSEPLDPQRDLGLAVHAALAGEIGPEELSEEARAIWATSLAEINRALAAWRPPLISSIELSTTETGISFVATQEAIIQEKRLWWKDRFSGRLDLAVIDKHNLRAIIIDTKSGWGDQTPSAKNLQLRTNAILLLQYASQQNIGILEEIEVGLCMPQKKVKYESVTYTTDDVWLSLKELDAKLKAAEQPNAELVTGAWCSYCPAEHVCPARESEFSKTLEIIEKKDQLAEWTPDMWGEFLKASTRVESFIKRKKAEAKRLLEEDPMAVKGYRIVQTETDEFLDVIALWPWMRENGVKKEDFGKAITIKKTAMKELGLTREQIEEVCEKFAVKKIGSRMVATSK